MLTQKKLNTSRFSEFICCEPCLQEFESVIAYRAMLLSNQDALDEMYKKLATSKGFEQIVEEHLVEEALNSMKVENNGQEFVDADAMTECNNCHEELSDSFVDHHVCPPVCPVKLEEEEEYSSVELELELDDSTSAKKKYPKKMLKDPITCPKCDRQFFYKAYFQFHYKDVHREDREEICQFCGKVFKNSRRLNSHILIHQTENEKKHKCDQCQKQFNFSGDLTRHKRVGVIVVAFLSLN